MPRRADDHAADGPRVDRAEYPLFPDLTLNAETGLWMESESFTARGLYAHYHAGLQVILAMTGGYEVEYGDVARGAEPGDADLIGLWEPHAIRYLANGRYISLWLLPGVLETDLDPGLSLLSMFAVPASQRPRADTSPLRELSLAVAHELHREWEQHPVGYDTVCRLHLLRLLIALRRSWTLPAPHATKSASASYMERIQPAIDLAYSKPLRRVRVAEAAAACGLSVPRFHQVFSGSMGISYAQFGRRARLAYAAQLLLNTDLSIDDVGREAGFSDGFHLSHRFLERYGRTPSEYRKQGRAAPDASAEPRS